MPELRTLISPSLTCADAREYCPLVHTRIVLSSISGRSYRYWLEGIRAKTARARRRPRIERLKGCRSPSNAHVIHKRTVPALPFAGPIGCPARLAKTPGCRLYWTQVQ